MRKDPVRFTSQWALIGVILFYSVGTTMISRHTNRIFKPSSAGGSERIEYSIVTSKPSLLGPVVEGYQPDNPNNNIPGLMPWGVDGSILLYENAFIGQQFSKNGIDSSPEKNDTQKGPIIIQTSFKCIESILKQAVIIPYQVNGQIIGLQMNGLEKISQAMTALLIKSGDVILAVNGKPVGNKKEAYKIIRKARKEPTMTVDILQDGEPKKIVLDLK